MPIWNPATTQDLTGYALLAGRAGGQTLKGGTGASENLILQSTDHATRGLVQSNDRTRVLANGASTPHSDWNFASNLLQLAAENLSTDLAQIAILYADASANAPAEFTGFRSRGTLAAPTDIQAGDTVAKFAAVAYKDEVIGNFIGIASMDFIADTGFNAVGANASSAARIKVMASGSSSEVIGLRIGNERNVMLGHVADPGGAGWSAAAQEILHVRRATTGTGITNPGSIILTTGDNAVNKTLGIQFFFNDTSTPAGNWGSISARQLTTANRSSRMFLNTTTTGNVETTALELQEDQTVIAKARLEIEGALDHDGTTVGFYGTTPTTQQTISGSRGGNAALADLLTKLALTGIIVDGTSA